MSFERNKGPIYLRLNIYFLIVFENTIIVETLLTFWHEYVRVKLRSLVRSRALRDIFETGDKDIKKGRATSCPAGGHWRGINHPCEGLHFNAWGWISNARARASEHRSEIASATTSATADATAQRFYATRARCAGYRRCTSLVTDAAGAYPASPCRTTPTTKRVVAAPRLAGSSFSFILLFFSFCSNVCHRISRRSIVVSSVVCNRNAR